MNEYNIPYDQLALVGLAKEAVNQLPEEFLRDLKDGKVTNIIVASNTFHNSENYNSVKVEMPMKLQVVLDEHGREKLIVYPVMRQFENTYNLNDRQFAALQSGDILHIDGHYIQRDSDTNCILKTADKDMNIEEKFVGIEKILDIELGIEQKNQLKEGKPVQLEVGGELVVVDIDLKNPNMFRTLHGDLSEWEYKKKVEYDISHPEYVGVVKTDENRWEYQQVLLSDKFPDDKMELKPKQAVSSGMKL